MKYDTFPLQGESKVRTWDVGELLTCQPVPMVSQKYDKNVFF